MRSSSGAVVLTTVAPLQTSDLDTATAAAAKPPPRGPPPATASSNVIPSQPPPGETIRYYTRRIYDGVVERAFHTPNETFRLLSLLSSGVVVITFLVLEREKSHYIFTWYSMKITVSAT